MKVTIESRVDPCSLAECLLFLQTQSMLPRTRSASVNACVELLASILKKGQHTVEIDSDDKAVMVLDNFFKGGSKVDISQISLKVSGVGQQVQDAADKQNVEGNE